MVRTRYAPSPTGSQHVGGIRTALYNWLFARKNNGVFYLRIEDTDSKRYKNHAVQELISALSWLGLDWDEGPSQFELMKLGVSDNDAAAYGKKSQTNYVQSNRTQLYAEYVNILLDKGLAYRVFGRELDDDGQKFSEAAREMNLRTWRDANKFMVKKALATGNPYHIRAKLPREDYIITNDRLRGDIKFEWQRQHDPVIMKTDGTPTYHFASVVDDHLMETTHVLRGEEWLSSLPIHFFLYQALDWQPPEFIHLPSILNPNGKGKMSKRKCVVDGNQSVPTLLYEYKNAGFLKEALINFMALTGWSPPNNNERFTLNDLIMIFDVDRINLSAAAWNYKKLLNINQWWLRNISDDDFITKLTEYEGDLNNVNSN